MTCKNINITLTKMVLWYIRQRIPSQVQFLVAQQLNAAMVHIHLANIAEVHARIMRALPHGSETGEQAKGEFI